jgi:hypothetical protein
LAQVVSLGYFRGVMNQLDDIEALQPECASFVSNTCARWPGSFNLKP